MKNPVKSYDYGRRRGVIELSWADAATLAQRLAESLAAADVDLVIGIARGGLIPATAVACALRRELYPVRLTRRVNDNVRYRTPVWRVDVPQAVAGCAVAIVDDIADSGETLALVAERVRQRGATRLVTTCLVSHSWPEPPPDLTALRSDALVVFPWDRHVLIDGVWRLHPELAAAMRLQGTPQIT